MKKEIYNIVRILPALLLALVSVVSCKEQEEETFAPSRMFMPTGAIQSVSGETEAKLSWKEALYVNPSQSSYTVEVATDSLFNTPVVFSVVTDTAGVTFTDEKLTIKQRYYARVKTNASGNTPESNWVTSSRFMVRGEQIFSDILASEIKDKSVVLRWRPSAGLTKIVLTKAGGTPTDIALTAADMATNSKTITGLTGSSAYKVEIYAGTKLKGEKTFTTKEPSIFTIEVAPTDDLAAIIANAANNEVIGLAPGIYDYSAANLNIIGKHITLQSISGDRTNTKVLFKEFTLKGTGAGLKVSGIEFDGEKGNAAYFINFTGLAADAEAATFRSVLIDNSSVRFTASALIRGNRGGNNQYKIDFIKINNSIIFDNGTGGFDYILLDKMEFNTVELTNSTFYNSGRRLLSWSTNLTAGPRPTILFNKITVNNFGYGARDYVLADLNTNNADLTITNSNFANAPKAGQTVGNNALRAGSGSVVRFSNNNTFNFTNGASPAVNLLFPALVQQSNNKTVNLGWTATTTNFALPAGSELRTSSTTGGPIGDPRWAL